MGCHQPEKSRSRLLYKNMIYRYLIPILKRLTPQPEHFYHSCTDLLILPLLTPDRIRTGPGPADPGRTFRTCSS